MRVIVNPERLALVGLPAGASGGRAEESAVAVLRTTDETTLLVPWDARGAAGGRVEGPFRLLTLDVALPWDVVGFLARVATALAARRVVLGAIAGHSRDHLLVKDGDLDVALETLRTLPDHERP